MNEIRFIDWYDCKDARHLKAYKQLQETGTWPEGFIPDDVVFDATWNITLKAKMADLYVARMLPAKTLSSIQDLQEIEKIKEKINLELDNIADSRSNLQDLYDELEDYKLRVEEIIEALEESEEFGGNAVALFEDVLAEFESMNGQLEQV